MESTIVLYIKVINKMIPKVGLQLILRIGRKVSITGREFYNLGSL